MKIRFLGFTLTNGLLFTLWVTRELEYVRVCVTVIISKGSYFRQSLTLNIMLPQEDSDVGRDGCQELIDYHEIFQGRKVFLNFYALSSVVKFTS